MERYTGKSGTSFTQCPYLHSTGQLDEEADAKNIGEACQAESCFLRGQFKGHHRVSSNLT